MMLCTRNKVSAQACCAGASVGAPWRIGRHDNFLLGLQLRAGHMLGNFGADGQFTASPSNTNEWLFEENLFGALKFAERFQIAAMLPFVQTWRSVNNISNFGGGLGDVRLAMRYDWTLSGEDRSHRPGWMQHLPGIAFLLNTSLPTGATADGSSLPLAADSTGTGVFELSGGIAFEHLANPFLFTIGGLWAWRNSRTFDGITLQLAPRWTFFSTMAYVFENHSALGLGLSGYLEGQAKVDGEKASDSDRHMVFLALTYLVPLDAIFNNERWKLHNAFTINPPIDDLGKNQPAFWSVAATLIYSWE